MFNGCIWRVYFVCYAAPHWLGEPKGWREYILVYCVTTSQLYVFRDQKLTAQIKCIELHEAILFAGSYCTLTPRFITELNAELFQAGLFQEKKETDAKEEKEVIDYMRIYLNDDYNNKSNKIEPVVTQFTQPSKHHQMTVSKLLYNGSLVYNRRASLKCCHSHFTVNKIDFLESAALGLQITLHRTEKRWAKCLRCFFLTSLKNGTLIFPGLAVWLLNNY